ncbi:SurA N-terminal domain-containing protein [Desertihabitans aurantiacus]|uniref:hypothetical protein n=1 Tax=Desertihabitans aurantiacus TaxID=2282477 RepID=UPI000DF80BA6|nr:hypothetical protein [Desertihabitans aurantiacus]
MSVRQSRRAALGRRLAAAGAVAVLVGGCANHPTDAAVVDGTAISESSLQTTVQAAARALGAAPTDINQRAVLASLVQGAVVDEVAEERGVDVDPRARESLINTEPQLQAFAADPEAAPLAEALADVALVQQQLGPEAFSEAFLAVPVTVNPRYGTWDPTSQEGLTGTGSLSVESYTTP